MRKVLKIVIGIFIILLLLFLATGIFVKETTYTVSTEVNKPVEKVFKTFNDHTIIAEWIPSIKSFEAIEEKEGLIGSTYKMIVDENGKEFEMIETLTDYEINKKVELEFDAQGMLKTNLITFISDGDKTIITIEAVCKGTTFLLRCTFPYFKSIFINADQENLDSFKTYIEK